MRESVFETLLGLFVVGAAAIFMFYALANGTDKATGSERYEVTARFNNVAGITRGSDVRLAGVKIGVVQSIEADFVRAVAQDGTGEIIYTRGSVDLLTLVGSFASSLGGGDSDDASGGDE